MRNATEPAGAAALAAGTTDAVELADVLLATTKLGAALLAATLVSGATLLVAVRAVLATTALEAVTGAAADADVLDAPPVAVPPQAAINVADAKPLSDTAPTRNSFRRLTRSLDTTPSFP